MMSLLGAVVNRVIVIWRSWFGVLGGTSSGGVRFTVGIVLFRLLVYLRENKTTWQPRQDGDKTIATVLQDVGLHV